MGDHDVPAGRGLLPRLTRTQIAAIAAAIAVVVEFSRLVHAPWLDAFRLTTAGALLLGRIFSLWNLVAHLIGIVAGVWLDGRVASFAQDRILPRRSRLNSQEAGSTRE
ncbi:hypothetical protein ABIB73_007017 [Bradyrhizobium sp. F1.4.3]